MGERDKECAIGSNLAKKRPSLELSGPDGELHNGTVNG